MVDMANKVRYQLLHPINQCFENQTKNVLYETTGSHIFQSFVRMIMSNIGYSEWLFIDIFHALLKFDACQI